MRFYYSFVLALLIFPFTQSSAQQVWQPVKLSQIPAQEFKEIKFVPSRYQLYKVQENGIRATLQEIVKSDKSGTIQLPAPDGSMISFTAIYSSVMEPGLEKNHPEIRTFSIQGIEDKNVVGRIGYNTSGLFGVISADNKEYLIQQSYSDSPYYFIYYSADDQEAQALLHESICPYNNPGE